MPRDPTRLRGYDSQAPQEDGVRIEHERYFETLGDDAYAPAVARRYAG
ncbi:hypothetical protein FHR71_003987 [Methylobacterium sp. RAS18]|nr:hypothetical protein [Methylobacterium sp. RAS18]